MQYSQNYLALGSVAIWLTDAFRQTQNVLTICLLVIAVMFTITAQAHNKVVVIPMAGDDAVLEPFALIPPDDTSSANYTSSNGVTLDLVTGLEWQQVDSAQTYTFDGADDYCSNLALNTKDNWRLPTSKELLSIVDFGTFSPAIDGSAFPATGAVRYWTATDANTDDNSRWAINFVNGDHERRNEISSSSVRARCVRSNGQNALVQVFDDNGDGSVTDLASGFTWQQQHDGNLYNYVEAISYCQNLVLPGNGNWRLPEVKELASLLDYRAVNPTIDSQLFPLPGEVNDFWTVSNVASDLGSAWGIGFGSNILLGGDAFRVSKMIPFFVRCVR